MPASDETELQGFAQALADVGVHIVCAAGAESVAACAVVGKAFKRAQVGIAGLTVVSYGERVDSPTWRAWLSDAPALLLVGLGVRQPLHAAMPQLSIDATPGDPLPARTLRLAETLAPLDDACWCAAVGLVGHAPAHPLVEQTQSRHPRDDLTAIAELLDAAARGAQPASASLLALELLTASPDPQRFLASAPAEVLRRTQALVHAELARATRIRPRPGYGVVVVEYESACHLEDLVAARWRGLRPGTAVLVANHGAVDGMVAVTATAAAPEAFDHRFGPLRATLGSEGTALIDADTWNQLLRRLGVAPAAIERLGDGDVAPSALPN